MTFSQTWVQTTRGRRWDLLRPRAEDVDFLEIAGALSVIPRFNGMTKRPYSVAQHCCLVHDALARENAPVETCLLGLLHDAHEAFVGDMTTPVQNAFEELLSSYLGAAGVRPSTASGAAGGVMALLERLQDQAIFDAAGLTAMWLRRADRGGADAMSLREDATAAVREMDRRILMSERDKLFPRSLHSWGEDLESIPRVDMDFHVWGPNEARWEWLRRLRERSEVFTTKKEGVPA